MNLSYAPFERRLRAPFRYGDREVSVRAGYVLRAEGPEGTIYSEASPLPGHSRDTLAEVQAALENFGAVLPPPALRFALAGLRAQESTGTRPVRSAALLPRSTPVEARAALARFAAEGYSVCKVKIGPEPEPEFLGALASGSALTYRLDGNLAIPAANLERWLKSLEASGLSGRIDYLEEPSPGLWHSRAFAGFPLPLAADESAPDEKSALALLSRPNPPAVIVVKPSVWGGFPSAGFQAAARAAKVRVVFGSSLEAEPGRRALLAYLSQGEHEPAGLCTGSLFEHDGLGDRAEWQSVPAPGAEEREWLTQLGWKELA